MEQQLLLPTDMEQQLFPTDGVSFCITGASFRRSCLNFSNGGWLSLALFAMVSAICFYTGNLIDRCMCIDRCVRSYPDIGYLAFGAYGWTTIGLVMYVELYLVAISFLILEGDNLDKLLPSTVVEILGYQVHGKQLFVLATAAVILPMTWLKNLSMLTYVSVVGLISSVALTGSGPGFHMAGNNLLNLSGLPTALTLYFVCFIGHGVFPTVYSSMKSRKDFPKVLLISSVLCSLNYAVTVVLRYLIYGEDVQSQVTQNLPTGKLYTRIAILTTLITPLANYTLVIQPVTTAIEEKLSATTDVENNWLTRVLTSIAIVISTVVLACTVPFFGYLMLFIGSSLNVTVAVLVPCLSYLKIYMFRGGVGCFERTMIVGILVIGVCVNVVGTYTSLHQIIGTF
uniref:Amino acid transporter transmembrane domain-containing protein n=1 Tax=Oryza barthii TaxID=65489 RepID=A0A0D3G6P6_9ORYZ